MRKHAAALCVCAASLLAAPAVLAQEYGSYGPADEQVIITAPRIVHYDHSRLNTPIEDVSLSIPVAYGDLNLRTWRGVRELRARIRYAAITVCSDLRDHYPVAVDGDSPCFRNAVAEAMPQADGAIQNARGRLERY